MNFHPWRLRTKLGCSDSSSFPPIVKGGGGGGRTTKQSSNHAKGKPCLSLLQTSDDIFKIRKILSIPCEYVTAEKKKKNFRNYAFSVWGMRGEANINNLPSSLLPPNPCFPIYARPTQREILLLPLRSYGDSQHEAITEKGKKKKVW